MRLFWQHTVHGTHAPRMHGIAPHAPLHALKRETRATWRTSWELHNMTKTTEKTSAMDKIKNVTLIHRIVVKIRRYTDDANEHAELTLDDAKQKRGTKSCWYRAYEIPTLFDFTNVANVRDLIAIALRPQSVMVQCQREYRDMTYTSLDAVIASDDDAQSFVVDNNAKTRGVTLTPDANKRAVMSYAHDGTLSPDQIRAMIMDLQSTLD
jgi:hypothetical protein